MNNKDTATKMCAVLDQVVKMNIAKKITLIIVIDLDNLITVIFDHGDFTLSFDLITLKQKK